QRPEPSEDLPENSLADARKALFRTGRGTRITSRDVHRMANRPAARVRPPEPDQARGTTLHAFRPPAAKLMLASGWDVKVVSQLLGHANISATQRYLDAIPGELAVAIRTNPLLARAMPTQPGTSAHPKSS